MTIHVARLEAICEVNPRAPMSLPDDDMVAFLPMAAVSEDGYIEFEESRPARDVKKGYTYFERGDVLVAKITPCFENGKAARTCSLSTTIGFGSTEFHVLRAGNEIDPSYLFHMIWNSRFRELGANNMTGSAGQKRVPADFLKRLEIPLPPLPEQRRIAAILDKADALRRQRKRAIELLDSLTQSIFLEMFGDPVGNPKRLPASILGELSEFVSGGTPPKGVDLYWNGEIPWVSPKDMKVIEISDAQDHVSEDALVGTVLKAVEPSSVLLVVRGMILAHTVPIAFARTRLTINQDMKAIRFLPAVNPLFGLWCLKAQHEYILSRVKTAAHGTRRLDMNDVRRIPILVPDRDQQNKFSSAATLNSSIAARARQSLAVECSFFSALQHRAFAGQL